MRNLTLLVDKHTKLITTHGEYTHFTEDYEEGVIYAITASNYIVGYASDRMVCEISLEDEDVIEKGARIVALDYIPELSSVCVASSAGDLIILEPTTQKVECVGIVDSGILCGAWSPDYHILVLSTGKGTLLAMTKEWEVLCETEHKTGTVSAITWRGDGAYFGCYGVGSDAGVATLSIWERPCTLSAKSTVASPSARMLSWRPSGQLIATQQGGQITFYERNGLQHGEFNLKRSEPIIQLVWSSDSEILAVVFNNAVQLWHCSNYKWFLKREISLYNKSSIAAVLWHPEDALCLKLFTKAGDYCCYDFCWDYNISDCRNSADPGIGVVVDEHALQITPLRFKVIPPPMYDTSVFLSAPLVSFGFGEYTADIASPQVHLVTATADNKIALYSTPNGVPKLLGELTTPMDTLFDPPLRHLIFASKPVTCLLAVQSTPEDADGDNIVQVDIQLHTQSLDIAPVVAHIRKTKTTKKILRLFRSTDECNIFVVLVDGTVLTYNILQDTEETLSTYAKFPSPCTWVTSATVGEEEEIIGLTKRGKLYAGDKLINGDCSSVAVHTHFLLFISHNMLNFIPLSNPIQVSIESQHMTSLPKREVENGARIVTAVAGDTKVVLQMPRGNLEVIHPQPLVVAAVRRTIINKEYRASFLAMRRHRIDLNLLYDLSPESFMENIEHFVDSVHDTEYLNLFISSLRDEDTTKTLFVDIESASIKERLTPAAAATQGKVNKICDALRSKFNKHEFALYFTPILTTYVKKTPPELGEALRLIQLLLHQEASLASEALDYVVFLVDVDKLYDVALGLYDFDLVLMVAQKSQKDPKEYLPFLTSLQKLEPVEFQHYTIDLHLERWDKALQNLALAGEQYSSQCISLITDHDLYEQAISLFSNNQNMLPAIYSAYGNWLAAKGKQEAAGHAYKLGGEYKKALSAFKDASKWREALSVAILLGFGADELCGLAYELAETLQTLGQHKDAATLLLQHASDPEAAIVALVEGGIWDDAIRLCELHARTDLITTHVNPSVTSTTDSQLHDIKENIAVWNTNVERLKVVRANKLLLPQYVGGVRPEGDEASIASGWSSRTGQSAASAASAMSSASAASISSAASQDSVVSWHSLSSKGLIQGGASGRQSRHEKKRKQQKRSKGKAGSPHEEEYIVDLLRGLIPSPSTQHGIGRLLRMLVHFGKVDTARILQDTFRGYLLLIQASLATINTSVEAVAQEKTKPTPAKLISLEQISWALDFWGHKID